MREREAIIHWKNLIVTQENYETKGKQSVVFERNLSSLKKSKR
jgi:hypothetical protein